MGFESSGWRINQGVVTIPVGVDSWQAYRFILEAIYDGHLPVTRVIGFSYRSNTPRKSRSDGGMLERNKDCLDDRMSIVSNLSKILLLGFNGSKVGTSGVKGEMRVSNTDFIYSRQKINVLSTSDYILTSSTEAALDLVINKSTQYRDASYNYNKIMAVANTTAKTRYLPMFSYHSVIDYVRVLPPIGNVIKLQYDNGMTDKYLIDMFEDLFELHPDNKWWSHKLEVLNVTY